MEHTLNHGMCRCCASEGMFKNFSATYQWMGADEVYSDMLKECFDIALTHAEDCNNGGICEVCITQLRNASNFKKQVLQTEEQFKKMVQDNLFKTNIVKVENSKDEDELESEPDNLSDPDYSGTEFEVPVKEEVIEPKTRKRAAKASTSSAKKAKTEDGEPSRTRKQRQVVIKIDNWDVSTGQIKTEKIYLKKVSKTRKAKAKDAKLDPVTGEVQQASDSEVKIEKEEVGVNSKKKYHINRSPELTKNRVNLKGILQYSNATPIRCRGDVGYACCFCDNQYPEPAVLKKHTIDTHDFDTMCNLMREKRVYSVKMDITGLQCQICLGSLHNIEQLVEHLVDTHRKALFKNIKSYIMPMKFESDVLQCFICSNTFNNYKGLVEHMNTHSRNFVCEVCDAGFLNRDILRHHSKIHQIGSYNCEQCSKTFNTYRKKKSHESSVHKRRNMLNKCGICHEKFNGHYKKIVHLSEVHGVDPVILNCKACDRKFKNRSALRIHIQRFHLMERPFSCTECDLSFYKKFELDKHMVKHTGVKEFQCEVCYKSYGRKSTLREHMRIHKDDRRFKCEHCGMSFVQRCSWRGHMKTKHGEQVQLLK